MKILITIAFTLLSIYTSNAQNIINLNSSFKSNAKNIKTTNDFIDAKRARELVLNEKVKTNKEINANDTILLDLFSNKKYKACVEKTELDVNGTLSISARIIGYDNAYCFITTFNGKSFITIDIPGNGEYYSSRYIPETKTYYLLEIDKTKAKTLGGCEPLVPLADNKDEIKKRRNNNIILNNPIIVNGENDPVTITVMVVYTPAAAAWAAANETNINNTISVMMQKSNLVHANSNTLVKLQLVHSQQVNYIELNNSSDLSNLRNTNDGFMDDVHGLRDTYAADLVMLLEVASYTGGQGYLFGGPSGSPSYGFSLTRVQQATSGYTVVHEWGHNMGCSHHKAQNKQPGPGLYTYSAGSRWTGNDNRKYCSVMTYAAGSYFSDGITHSQVPHFSNPSVLYAGIATGHTADADNARTIRQVKSIIANYRTGKANQSISASGWQTKTFGDTDFDHNITSSSGLPVTLISSNTAVATILGSKIRIVSAGTSTITATQLGNADFNAAPNLNLLLTVNKANQSITFPTLLTMAINAPNLEPGATTSSGLAVTYASSNTSVATIIGEKIRSVALGTATITAFQAGNSNYNPASSVSRLLTVVGLSQTITFNAFTNKIFGDPDFEISATTSSGLVPAYISSNPSIATIIGTKVKILNAGTVNITALQPGNLTYSAAQNIMRSLTISKAQQTISFPEIGFKNYNDADFALSATSSVGLPIAYKSSNANIATVTGNNVRIVSDGSVAITAMQVGNTNYNAALDVTKDLIVGYVLPANNFRIKATEETCKTSNNGTITINATQALNYTATITGANKNITQNFNTTMQATGLEAGTYNIYITVAGSSTFKQCFDVIIKEPKDLSVFSSVVKEGNLVLLKLDGSDFYIIELNGVITTTTQQEISLPLIKGNNIIKISTNKLCKGIIEKVLLTNSSIQLYPNPVKDLLNINFTSTETKRFKIDVQSLEGRLIATSNQQVENGIISLNTSNLPRGMYILILTSKNERTVHKFIKD